MSAIPGRATACTPSSCRAWPTTPGPSPARRRATSPTSRPAPGEGRGLLEALAANAAAVVTDDAPVFFLPRMIAAAAGRLDVRARSGRRQRPASAARGRPRLPDRVLVSRAPAEDPAGATSTTSRGRIRWPASACRRRPTLDAVLAPLAGGAAGAPHRRRGRARGPADRSRRRAGPGDGAGPRRGSARLKAFVGRDLATYADDRHDPDDPRTSGLSPYLHFGHVSAHEVFDAVMTHEGWTRRQLAASGGGKREGWWGVSARRRGVPRPARDVARDRLQRRRAPRRPRPLRHAAGVGAGDAGGARPRSAAAPLRSRRVRAGGDARSAVERRADGAGARRPHPHLPAHAVGQEDPRMVARRRRTRSTR